MNFIMKMRQVKNRIVPIIACAVLLTAVTVEPSLAMDIVNRLPLPPRNIPQPTISVSGNISQNTTWYGVVRVTGDIEVSEGVTLTISSGTIVLMDAHSDDQGWGITGPPDPVFPFDPPADDNFVKTHIQISINGALLVNGQPDNMVTFTSNNPSPTTYDWHGISINSGKTEIRYAIIEYARYVSIKSDIIISHSVIRHMLEAGLLIFQASNKSVIEYTYIYDTQHDGIKLWSSSPHVHHNVIRTAKDVIPPGGWERFGISGKGAASEYVSLVYSGWNTFSIREDSFPIFEYNVIDGTERQAMFVIALNTSHPIVRYNLFKNAGLGMEIHDQAGITAYNNNVYEVERYAVCSDRERAETFDVSNNYCGTSNPESITSMMDPKIPLLKYTPFLTSPDLNAPVPPPTGLTGSSGDRSVIINWQPVNIADIAGYKIHYDTDTSEFPYQGKGANEGASPINVGNVTSYTLTGLEPGKTYFIAVSAYDSTGENSWHSAEELALAPNTIELGRISGTVKSSVIDYGVPGIQVTSNPGNCTVTTGPTGYYRFNDIEPGTYSVSVSGNGSTTTSRTGIGVTADGSTVADFVASPLSPKGGIWRAYYYDANGMDAPETIAVDNNGAVWFGGRGHIGATRLYDNIWTEFEVGTGLADPLVWRIAPDNAGGVWVIYGWYGTSVSKFDGTKWTHYTAADGLAPGHTTSVAVEKNGTVWFGTEAGACKFDGTNWTTYPPEVSQNAVCSNNALVDNSGDVWFASSNGVTKYDGNTWTTYTTSDGLADNGVNGLAVDATGNVWFAASGGVSKYDGNNWTTYRTADGLSGIPVRAVTSDSKGNMWFGTHADGVSKYDGASWTQYRGVDGLISNNVKAIAQDKAGNMWFGTGVGIIYMAEPVTKGINIPAGEIKIEIPAEAVSKDFNIFISTSPAGLELDLANQKDDLNAKINRLEGSIIEITLKDLNGITITENLKNNALLTIPYFDNDDDGMVDNTNPAINEETLEIYTLAGGAWVRAGTSSVDTGSNKVSINIPHFSVFVPMGSNSAASLNEVFCYPVPCRACEKIVFKRLTSDANINIYTITSELVRSLENTGGDDFEEWDLKNSFGEKVASGVYLYVVKDKKQTKKSKLAILR